MYLFSVFVIALGVLCVSSKILPVDCHPPPHTRGETSPQRGVLKRRQGFYTWSVTLELTDPDISNSILYSNFDYSFELIFCIHFILMGTVKWWCCGIVGRWWSKQSKIRKTVEFSFLLLCSKLFVYISIYDRIVIHKRRTTPTLFPLFPKEELDLFTRHVLLCLYINARSAAELLFRIVFKSVAVSNRPKTE